MDYLSLSRAARLAGVTRAELQARIRRGEIPTFEGAVAVSDLLRAYPSVTLANDDALERTTRIKTLAHPKLNQAGETTLPDPDVLLSRLQGLSAGLAERALRLDAALALLDQIGEQLDALCRLPRAQLDASLLALRDWLGGEQARLAAAANPDQHAQLIVQDAFLRLMAANVKLIPSGHDFFVEGNESILDASVRAGLTLNYGCASGNCGDCKARVVSGETWRLREHDYVISEREKAMGYILTCSHTAVTDLVLEAAEAQRVEDLPYQMIRASLRQVERLGPDLLALNLQTPRTQTLRFMAGQRAILTLENGAAQELSIASCPCNGRQLWFYVRRDTDAFSHAVFNSVRPGQLVTVSGPLGRFVLRDEATEPAIFIAHGDGIAPIKSLIEHAVSIDHIESFQLYWDTRYPEAHHQVQWVRALRDALDHFSFTPLVSGRVEDLMALLNADLADPMQARFYIAGPVDAVSATQTALLRLGVAAERIATEGMGN
ncbi:CDP-4-dehydro-6-deoxyglucose reductase [Allochromatium warmingii]|uniref:CDP-4-dehydro-6-deoxyglucose reductase n=1 Tax=Allochromatium warmingii TaxID=61595 RepID=A0A1H3GNZ9_ALLWA|nr:2Fe-2S iron-sulfur cluster-binding protein [Allochromatium warmingii]SDY04770.1 CDP-4-dehydro-6-deoxyglucose reductase [Allochromatium warmingii]